jgi:hypothetical protein
LASLEVLDGVEITEEERKESESIALKQGRLVEILKQNLQYLCYLVHLHKTLKLHLDFAKIKDVEQFYYYTSDQLPTLDQIFDDSLKYQSLTLSGEKSFENSIMEIVLSIYFSLSNPHDFDYAFTEVMVGQ